MLYFKYIFWILIISLFLPIHSLAKNKTRGLDKFNINPIGLSGRIKQCIPLDLNQDGLLDLLITHLPKTSKARLVSVIFQKDGSFSPQSLQSWQVPVTVTALACGDYLKSVPGIEIGYITAEGFYICPLESPSAYNPKPYLLFKTTSLFNAPDEDALPVWQLPVDLDNNQADDLIIPQQDGYTIYFQAAETTSAFTAVSIKAPCRKIIRKSSTSWLTITQEFTPLRIVDVNQDGLKDLVSLDGNQLIYYVQSSPRKFTTRQFELKYLQDILKDKEISSSSISFSDINQDGLLDFVVSALGGDVAGLSQLVTRYFIYLATPDANQVGGLSYPDTPNQIINLKGVSPLIDIGDVNNDGRMDLLLASFQTSLGSNFKKALLRYVRVNYQLHLFQTKRGRFSRKPDYEHKVNLPFKLVGKGKKYFSHFYLKHDYNNDGRADRLTISGPDKKRGVLSIRPGWPRERLMKKDGVGFRKDEYLLYPLRIPQQVLVRDFNNDGRADLVLLYRSSLLTMISK